MEVVSRDLNSFSQFARDVLINLPNVKDLHTSFSLGEVKASSALPLDHLNLGGTAAARPLPPRPAARLTRKRPPPGRSY